jgi:hypothetical protein
MTLWIDARTCWVLCWFTWRPGVDYDETFNLVVKTTTVRTVLTLTVSRGCPVQQLNIKNTFLHGHLHRHGLLLPTRHLR